MGTIATRSSTHRRLCKFRLFGFYYPSNTTLMSQHFIHAQSIYRWVFHWHWLLMDLSKIANNGTTKQTMKMNNPWKWAIHGMLQKKVCVLAWWISCWNIWITWLKNLNHPIERWTIWMGNIQDSQILWLEHIKILRFLNYKVWLIFVGSIWFFIVFVEFLG